MQTTLSVHYIGGLWFAYGTCLFGCVHFTVYSLCSCFDIIGHWWSRMFTVCNFSTEKLILKCCVNNFENKYLAHVLQKQIIKTVSFLIHLWLKQLRERESAIMLTFKPVLYILAYY